MDIFYNVSISLRSNVFYAPLVTSWTLSPSVLQLTHFCRMHFPIIINWTSSFPILGLLGCIFHFIQIFKETSVSKRLRTWSEAAFCCFWSGRCPSKKTVKHIEIVIIHAENINTRRKFVSNIQTDTAILRTIWHAQMQRGGMAIRITPENHKNIGFFLAILVPIPWNITKDTKNSKWVWSGNTTITNRSQPHGTIRCWTSIGPPAKRYYVAFSWRTNNDPSSGFWISSTKKRCQNWTPSDITFWIRACLAIICRRLIT